MDKVFLMILVSFFNTAEVSNDNNDKFYAIMESKYKAQYEFAENGINENTNEKEVISINDDDFYLLTKLVTGEARGESYEGQVAVAAVVINRVKDSRFPNSVKDVVYQKNAFSVVDDGSINLNPTDESVKAVKEALYGKDPTSGAIYFWNPRIATCKWIRTLNPYKRIGNHVFAK